MLQYKVLTDHDKRFSGNFDGDALETTLNRYAADGWRWPSPPSPTTSSSGQACFC